MKHLCDLSKKGFEKVSEKIYPIVIQPEFVCKKCLRVANTDKRLCKPAPLEK